MHKLFCDKCKKEINSEELSNYLKDPENSIEVNIGVEYNLPNFRGYGKHPMDLCVDCQKAVDTLVLNFLEAGVVP